VTVPAVVIRCELGQPPVVTCEWNTDLDDERMTNWLDQHPQVHNLIVSAIELAEQRGGQERAA
jgi:hypothetical protein